MFTSCSPRPHQRWSLGSHDLRPPNRFTPTSDDTPVRHPPTLPSPGPITDTTLPTPRLTSPWRHLPLLRTPTTAPPPTPLPPTPPPRQPTFAASATRRHLDKFNKKYLGLADFDTTAASLGEQFYSRLTASRDDILRESPWTSSLPSRTTLLRTAFGRPDSNHSFTQEASFETCLLPLLQSGFVDVTTTIALLATHPLVLHLAISYISLRQYNFRWIRSPDPTWATQTCIPATKQ